MRRLDSLFFWALRSGKGFGPEEIAAYLAEGGPQESAEQRERAFGEWKMQMHEAKTRMGPEEFERYYADSLSRRWESEQ